MAPLLEVSFAWSNQMALGASDVVGFLSSCPHADVDTVCNVVRMVYKEASTRRGLELPPPLDPYHRRVFEYSKHLEEVFDKDLSLLNSASPEAKLASGKATTDRPKASAATKWLATDNEAGPSKKKQKK
jgi:hypothetical protein